MQEGRGICLCAQAPSAVWVAAQHPARQLFSLVRVDTKARPLIFIFLLRVLSAVSLSAPETGEFTVCPMASLEGSVAAVTLFFRSEKKKKGRTLPLPIAVSDKRTMCCLISYKFIALWAEKHKHSVSCPCLCVLSALCCRVAAGGFSHYCLDAGLAGSSPCSSSGWSFLDRVPTTLRCTLITFSDLTPHSPLNSSCDLGGGGGSDHSWELIVIVRS